MEYENPEMVVITDIETPEKSVLRRVIELNDKIRSLEHRIRILKKMLGQPAGIREKIKILFQIREMQARLKQYKDRLSSI